ncbi:MAG TPA: polysaccharide deacetylase family protein [Verrucomicrobiae bacterium]
MSKHRWFRVCLLLPALVIVLVCACAQPARPVNHSENPALRPEDSALRRTNTGQTQGTVVPNTSALGMEVRYGAVIRGPRDRKRLALVFTGHEFAEGAESILNQLARHRAKASFFLTGDFLRNPSFVGLVGRMVKDGHKLGPHSDKHLLYCSWEKDRKTLVSREQFETDLSANLNELQKQAPEQSFRYFLPPYEHYNQQITDWARTLQLVLVNFTAGTRSTADYTGEADANFVSTADIFESIVRKERQDPDGLRGFILLLHLGAGPGRADKFHARFGELLDFLAAKGYQPVTLQELLESQGLRGR